MDQSLPADTDLADDALRYIKVAEAAIGLGFSLWLAWTLIVPAAFKIELRARWDSATRRPVNERNRAIAEIHASLIAIEVADEGELAAAVQRLPRAT
jgi:hypothetical protein